MDCADHTPEDPPAERQQTPRGELALRRRGAHWELISNGVFLMDTRDGRSARRLAEATLAAAWAPRRMLIGGLGVGFTTAAALAHPGVTDVVVVEIEAAVIRWQSQHFSAHVGHVQRDPRCQVVHADLVPWLAADRGRFDAVCLDIDNGPGWTVSAQNAGLYRGAGLDRLVAHLAEGGALGVWSAAADPTFDRALQGRFATVHHEEIPVSRGEPDVITVACSPAKR